MSVLTAAVGVDESDHRVDLTLRKVAGDHGLIRKSRSEFRGNDHAANDDVRRGAGGVPDCEEPAGGGATGAESGSTGGFTGTGVKSALTEGTASID